MPGEIGESKQNLGTNKEEFLLDITDTKPEIELSEEEQQLKQKFLSDCCMNRYNIGRLNDGHIPKNVAECAEVKELLKNKILEDYKYGSEFAYADAFKNYDYFDIVDLPEIQEVGKKAVLKALHSGRKLDILDIMDALNLPIDFCQSEEVMKAIENEIEAMLGSFSGHGDEVEKRVVVKIRNLAKRVGISNERINELSKKYLLKRIEDNIYSQLGDHFLPATSYLKLIQEEFGIEESELGLQNKIFSAVNDFLGDEKSKDYYKISLKGIIDLIEGYKIKLLIPSEWHLLFHEKLKNILTKKTNYGIIASGKIDEMDYTINLMTLFGLDFNGELLKESIENKIIDVQKSKGSSSDERSKNEETKVLIEFAGRHNIEIDLENVFNDWIKKFKNKSTEEVSRYLHETGTYKHLSASENFRKRVVNSVFDDIYYRVVQRTMFIGDFSESDIMKFIKEIDPSMEFVESAAKNLIANFLSNGNLEKFFTFKEQFNLSDEIINDPEIQSAAKIGFLNSLKNYRINVALEIKEKLNLSQKDVESLAKEAIIYLFERRGGEDTIAEIKEKFNVSISIGEIIEAIPKLKYLLEKIKEISPEFCEQAQKSVEIISVILRFAEKPDEFSKTIEENPFLAKAVSENPRFGSKLLIKYPEFDENSKENIGFLFEAKKEILAENPEMDPESLEFRESMQEKLKQYKNNPEILKELKAKGIDVEQWLGYSETRYFQLESGEGIRDFSETISTPINRVKETIDAYAFKIKEVLKEYKKELSDYKITLEDSGELQEKITRLQTELEKAKAEGNEKKAVGIQKGIDSWKLKMESVKKTALWDKLLGDISVFQRLKDDVFAAQENLLQAEKKLSEVLSKKLPSGKMIQEIKQDISKAKEELRTKFVVLERRIDDFKNNLPELIAPALGQERTEALIQEIEQSLAEQFSHYSSDRSTLSNLFSEKGDKEKDKLENQPMSIFVWARNPDIDLYQGNYSPCCICIDSEHMGAESTIADYNTDLGVQIVNIWDEAKNEPVTAAWCWIGINKKGETVLVVDNIESNTNYSANYPEQLTEELFAYLEEYAKVIGAKKVVLGKANNDLPTGGELAKMPNDKRTYKKLGGYNREDGYFLEAEDESIKVVWENKETEKKETTEKKPVEKVKFGKVAFRGISQKDFDRIINLEKKIYEDTGLALGRAMTEDIEKRNGEDYSELIKANRHGKDKAELVGYLVALEDETEEGDPCVYLEDIAVLPEAQRQEVGWRAFKRLVVKLKVKAEKDGKPVLLDMHLRENSQAFFDKYKEQLEELGIKLIEEVLVPDYYDQGQDSLYRVYKINS